MHLIDSKEKVGLKEPETTQEPLAPAPDRPTTGSKQEKPPRLIRRGGIHCQTDLRLLGSELRKIQRIPDDFRFSGTSVKDGLPVFFFRGFKAHSDLFPVAFSFSQMFRQLIEIQLFQTPPVSYHTGTEKGR